MDGCSAVKIFQTQQRDEGFLLLTFRSWRSASGGKTGFETNSGQNTPTVKLQNGRQEGLRHMMCRDEEEEE